MHEEKLIINAGDYDLSENFNRGILELIKKRVVTSTTVIVNKKFIEPKELLKYKNISIGLHQDPPFESSVKDAENQIRKFKMLFGQLLSHLDGHQHCCLFPSNLPKITKIAKKYNLPVRSRFSKNRKILKRHKIKTPNRFISWHPTRKNKLFKDLKKIQGGVTELLCHPGHFNPKVITSYNKQREAGLRILKSRQFKKLIGNFELINYEQI